MNISALEDLLSSHRVLNLAYCDVDGPGACALWYAHDSELNLYFLSSTSTRHGNVLQYNPEVAFTIQRDKQDWQSIIGLQGRGKVFNCKGDQLGWQVYTQKFSFVLQQFEDLQSALEKTELWKITPSWIRRIDNTVSFGFKEEINIELAK